MTLGGGPRAKRTTGRGLSGEQQRRLTALGVTPAERPRPETTSGGKAAGKLSAAFQRGAAALAQYITREGTTTSPGATLEEITVDGHDTAVNVRLGVFMSNTRSRRDELTEPQRTALAELGVEWA
ncbi:Helicase associated domain protein [Streptomyces sp. DSM 41524]|uniref:Helicase associated domain protein n=1 Tax=Streptomyces asiaticus subsp. ignotus TaxID=3098222 RepID=A0ABU7QBJ3_9ACTN|nr:Helicase associated domain protein [Streptomyces sp. DSM 41524]